MIIKVGNYKMVGLTVKLEALIFLIFLVHGRVHDAGDDRSDNRGRCSGGSSNSGRSDVNSGALGDRHHAIRGVTAQLNQGYLRLDDGDDLE